MKMEVVDAWKVWGPPEQNCHVCLCMYNWTEVNFMPWFVWLSCFHRLLYSQTVHLLWQLRASAHRPVRFRFLLHCKILTWGKGYGIRKGTYEFRKVKSHIKPSRQQDAISCFRAWGNKKADEAAVTACWHLCPQIVNQAVQLRETMVREADQLRQVFALRLQLHAARAKLDQVRKQSQV